MSEDMNQIEVNNYVVGDKLKASVTKVEEKQVIVELSENAKARWDYSHK